MSIPLYQSITPFNRWLITFAVMSATLMQVIDTTIVNVALPPMQGSLGASADEITWTLTSYLISSAIFMPLTGYFTDRFGRKKYLIVAILGFTITSALCGASTSLAEIILFRLLQGVFGASLVPLSQAILGDIFPPEDRGKAMAIWGVGVMVGPILGPTLGGYLTDVANWRWTFYVNVPIGFFSLLLSSTIPESKTKSRTINWRSLFFISIAIGGLQLILDRGNQADWFNATSICVISYLSLTSFLAFLFINHDQKHSAFFDPKIFQDRNFVVASILLCVFGLGLYGMMVIQPMMLEGLFHYSVLTTGLMMAPRGISGMVSMMLVGKVIKKVEPRTLIIIGLLISMFGMHLGTYYSLTFISPFWLIMPLIIQGFGLGMVFVPLATIAFSTLPSTLSTEAAGIYSLVRTIGSAIGISITITLYTRKTQLFWQQLGGFIHPYNPFLPNYLANLNINLHHPLAPLLLAQQIYQQASMLAFTNVYAFISACFLVMLPLVFFLNKRVIQR